MGDVIPFPGRGGPRIVAGAPRGQLLGFLRGLTAEPRHAISGEARDGLIHMAVPSPTFALTPAEAEVWASNLQMLADAAREQRDGGK